MEYLTIPEKVNNCKNRGTKGNYIRIMTQYNDNINYLNNELETDEYDTIKSIKEKMKSSLLRLKDIADTIV